MTINTIDRITPHGTGINFELENMQPSITNPWLHQVINNLPDRPLPIKVPASVEPAEIMNEFAAMKKTKVHRSQPNTPPPPSR